MGDFNGICSISGLDILKNDECYLFLITPFKKTDIIGNNFYFYKDFISLPILCKYVNYDIYVELDNDNKYFKQLIKDIQFASVIRDNSNKMLKIDRNIKISSLKELTNKMINDDLFYKNLNNTLYPLNTFVIRKDVFDEIMNSKIDGIGKEYFLKYFKDSNVSYECSYLENYRFSLNRVYHTTTIDERKELYITLRFLEYYMIAVNLSIKPNNSLRNETLQNCKSYYESMNRVIEKILKERK